MFYGFGIDDDVIAAHLPPRMARIVIDELRYNPSIAPRIAELLQSARPELAIAREISASAAAGLEAAKRSGLGGMSDFGMGKNVFQRVSEAVSNVAQTVQEQVSGAAKNVPEAAKVAGSAVQETAKKVFPYTSIPAFVLTKTKFGENVVRKTREAARVYGPTALKVAGIVAAPFTGGASLAVTALVQAREQLMAQKRAAAAAKKAASADAAQQQQAADTQEAILAQQTDDFFYQNIQGFAQYGITQDKWSKMTLDQKLDTVNKISSGELKPIPVTGQPYDTTVSEGVPAQDASQRVPSGGGGDIAGLFELYVEGQKVAEASTADEISQKISSLTKPGDRFEVFYNGTSTGLNVRTPDGAVDVPANQAAVVESMPAAQVQGAVKTAAKGSALPWVLAGVAAAGYAVFKQ
jgi:hypothetical protein